MTAITAAFDRRLGPGRLRSHEPLAPFTTFRVGGPADWFVEPQGRDELLTVLALAHELDLPITMLGGGSNVLIADRGVRGLVIRPRGGEVVRLHEAAIRADAAMTINGLVRWTISHGAAGLEAWAGTPGTVAGAIFGNAHYAGRNISEFVTDVELWRPDGEVVGLAAAEMQFGYDRSRLQSSREILLTASFRVADGDPVALRTVARESLAFRKRTQPLESPSAGCIFQNPQRGVDVVPDGIPWSAGALVDRAGLKGATQGAARVATTHANFIVNDGGATSDDIRQLVQRCRDVVAATFGVVLREEIVYLGDFDA